MITIKDIAWVAGILEGEGSFGLSNKGRSPCIWLGMSDKDVVKRFSNIVGRTHYVSISEDKRKETYKTQYRLTLNGTLAIQWLFTIYSLMGERRKSKIREIILIWKETELKQSQSRNMSPEHQIILGMMKLGLTMEQAQNEFARVANLQT